MCLRNPLMEALRAMASTSVDPSCIAHLRRPEVEQRRFLIIEHIIKGGMVPRAYKELEAMTGVAATLLASAVDQSDWFSRRDGKVWVTGAGWQAWRMENR